MGATVGLVAPVEDAEEEDPPLRKREVRAGAEEDRR